MNTKLKKIALGLATVIALCPTAIGCRKGGTSSKDLSHTHRFAEKWQHDGATHWRFALCCSKVKQEQAHTYPATGDKVCAVCGYMRVTADAPSAGKPDDEVVVPVTPVEPSTPSDEPQPPVEPTEPTPPVEPPELIPPVEPQEPVPEQPIPPTPEQPAPPGDESTTPPAPIEPVPDDTIVQPTPSEPTDDGLFVIPHAAETSITGLEDEYILTVTQPQISPDGLEYSVSIGGKTVPKKHITPIIWLNETQIAAETTALAPGGYRLEITLKDVKYEDGSVPENTVKAVKTFTVSNPVTGIKLKSGKTAQTASATDKMSGGWAFEAVLSNGETTDIPREQITVPELTTDVVGRYTVTFAYGAITGEAAYVITERPQVIKGIEATLDTAVTTEVEGDSLTLDVDDFAVAVTATGDFKRIGAALVYGGNEEQTVTLAADARHTVTVKVTFEYESEGETLRLTLTDEVEIEVTKKAPPVIQDDKNLTVDSTTLGEYANGAKDCVLDSSANGAIALGERDGFTLSTNGVLTVTAKEVGPFFTGLTFTINRTGRIELTADCESFALVGIAAAQTPDDPMQSTEVIGETAIAFDALSAGEYILLIVPTDPHSPVTIKSLSISFE